MNSKNSKQKIVVILGPTATGKSDFAVELAKKINGEIISADSRQVYIGLDIGSGKITKKEMKGVPHHLLDVTNPKKEFSVADYKKLADKKIEEIISRGKIPIIVGGTGFYIDSVINDSQLPEVKPNKNLRKELEKLSTGELFKILKKLDPRRAKEIDAKNPVRLIRAIEIAKTLGKVPKLKTNPKYNTITIGLDFPDYELKERIEKRLISRFKNGMLDEAKKLHSQGLSFKRMEQLGLEYRYMAKFLQGKITEKEMVEKLNLEIWKYAKRQRTWFKRDKNIIWVK
ncbi:MAG TPA: tRNA (adenosine(37)-N6)-dimethylallyltransferase MiaA [Candidatus Paceibacterota bacterium]|nr:tRNA (adenosine(37)-N6)-dimethylallyltransferase MiaA [Candidatus Paceibacterota bacterium]